jgi:hypothetical protein
MPMTAAQLAIASNYQLEFYTESDPVDQITRERPFLDWLLANKVNTAGGNAYYNEKVRIANDSNYQNYYGDDQVSFNRRDTVRLAKFAWYNHHDGFALNEDELVANGIITYTDDANAVVSGAEKFQLVNILKENYTALKEGVQEQFDIESHLDGSQNAKAVPGLDHLVSTTPTTGTVGGINAATATYWRNNASMAISLATPGNLTTKMEQMWRANRLYGGMTTTDIFVGQAFLDAYRAEFQATIVRQAQTGGRAVAHADTATEDLYFHGLKLVWDPTFEALDTLLGAITYPWTKRAYFLNRKTIKLRPISGHWMVNRKPPRMYDRYVHYFGLTSKYRMTINKRNANAVLSIA